ncbi:hypothetical protein [Streptomyces griseorubiginosus]|uniref:hypothetical protein n=1 Tax=Streptomyces griseorubiginosus TaxID=67304 RepID=UPI00215A7CDB|nr:hypothetical protein [Streptomyces griseorubiginosus]
MADPAPEFPLPAPTPAAPTSAAPSRTVDELDGVSLPLPGGWAPARHVTRDRLVMTTEGGKVCTRTLPVNSARPPA